MNTITTALSTGLLTILLAAGAVVAEPPPLPQLALYKGDALIQTRPMTPAEHTQYLKMKLAIETLGNNTDVEDLTNASKDLAVDSMNHALHAIRQHQDEGSTENHTFYRYSFAETAEQIDAKAGELASFGSRIGKATEGFKQEVARNSQDIDYDSVRLGKDASGITLELGK